MTASPPCPSTLANNPHTPHRRITKTAYPETVDFTKPQPCGGAAVEAAAKSSKPAAASPSRDFQTKCSKPPAPRTPSFYDWLVEYTLAVTTQPSGCVCSVPSDSPAKVTFTAADNCGSATVIKLGALGRSGCAYVGCTVGQTFSLLKGEAKQCGVKCDFNGQAPPDSVTVDFEWNVSTTAPAKLQRVIDFDWSAGEKTFTPSKCFTLTDTFIDAPEPVNTPEEICYPTDTLGFWAAEPITYEYPMSQSAICPLQDDNGIIQVGRRAVCWGCTGRVPWMHAARCACNMH